MVLGGQLYWAFPFSKGSLPDQSTAAAGTKCWRHDSQHNDTQHKYNQHIGGLSIITTLGKKFCFYVMLSAYFYCYASCRYSDCLKSSCSVSLWWATSCWISLCWILYNNIILCNLLKTVVLSDFILSFLTLGLIMLNGNAKHHYPKCCYAECHFA
jgi:hypothetical protein